MSKFVGEILSFDKKSWSHGTYLCRCLTIFDSLRATNMLRLLINIDLKPPAKFHENTIKMLPERTIPQ